MTKSKKFLFYTIMFVFLSAFFLVAGEMLFRFSGLVPQQKILTKDSRLGWTLTGRSLPDPGQLPVDRPTVVVLGDSFTAPGHFIHAAEKKLEDAGCPVNFINLGVHGYGQMQEWRSWQVIGKNYKPEYVILAAFLWNDLSDNLNDIFYSYVAHVNREGMRYKDGEFHISDRISYTIMPDFLLDNSYLARGIDFIYFNILSSYYSYGHPKVWGDFYLRQETARSKEGYAVFEEILRQLADDVKKEDAGFGILSFDNGFTVMPETLKDAEAVILDQKMPYSVHDLDLDLPQKRIRDIADRLGVPFLDGLKALRQTSEPPYGPGLSGHFNTLGNKVIGDMIADHLMQEGLCPNAQGAGRDPE